MRNGVEIPVRMGGRPTVCIVGGGFSGTVVAVQLLRRGRGALRVVLIERGERCGPGLAYGTTCAEHLLNVPAGNMSAIADEPGHFVSWARARGEAVNADTFAPRMLYGNYLCELLEDAIRGATREQAVEQVRSEARDIEVDGDGARVTLRDGRAIAAEHVVLAIGNFPPASPRLGRG